MTGDPALIYRGPIYLSVSCSRTAAARRRKGPAPATCAQVDTNILTHVQKQELRKQGQVSSPTPFCNSSMMRICTTKISERITNINIYKTIAVMCSFIYYLKHHYSFQFLNIFAYMFISDSIMASWIYLFMYYFMITSFTFLTTNVFMGSQKLFSH
jgi:hypothetical protein